MTPKKYLITCDTNWCGEDVNYTAIAFKKSDIEEIAQRLAYENFDSFDGFETMMKDLFPEVEDGEYSGAQIEEGYAQECNYYGFTIEKFEGSEEEWNDYDLIHDCTKK